MPSRTAEYIDAQKQQADALARAQASGAAAGQTAAIQSTPPGYITGFKTVLTPELKIDIWPGVANVAGQRVELKETYTLRPEDETMTRLSKAWWYLYIDRSGVIHGDIIPPEFKPDWMGYYHKNQPWRNIGRYFVCDDHLCYYAANWQQASEQTVYVAPSTFGGIANYYCTGVDDQILINAAIKYLHEAYDGGKVELLQGRFIVQPTGTMDAGSYTYAIAAFDYDNITINGSGGGTVIEGLNPTSGAYKVMLGHSSTTSTCSNVTVQNITLESQLLRAIRAHECHNLTIHNVKFSGFNYQAIYTDTCNNLTISGNRFDGLSGGNNIQAIQATGGNYISVAGNKIYDMTATTLFYCIYLDATGPAIVNNNQLYNCTGSSASVCYGISTGSDVVVSDNYIDDLDNTNTALNCYAIRPLGSNCIIAGNYIKNCSGYGIGITSSGTSQTSVTDNYCYNNGSDTGIANTNRNNFYDAGTDTQCSG